LNVPVDAATPVRDALDSAVIAIAAAGCETPRLDAELLLAHVLGVSRERLLLDCDLAVAGPSVRAFREAVRRRAFEREPVAYICGSRAFRRLQLRCDRRALIPRPETELLVEVACARLPAGASVLDVGTGCGAVALALEDERPDLRVTGSDISADALELARANGEALGLDVRWLHADLLAGVPDEFDAVVANLPYVAESERASLAPEIMRHEPAGALFAGADGLSCVRRLVREGVGRFSEEGSRAVSGRSAGHVSEDRPRARARMAFLALEVGSGQAGAVSELMGAAGFGEVRAEPDLAGIQRVVVGVR
jgi:release factor glutamine methyltransferase